MLTLFLERGKIQKGEEQSAVYDHVHGHHFGLILELGDFGVEELFLLDWKWLVEEKQHLEVFI